MTEDQQGQTFGTRYRPERLIARGGMADVYEARDLLLDRLVALKVLFPELSTNPTFVERFRREAQSAAALSHPNIVSVYDWGPANSTYFIAMELVTGSTLADVIRESGTVAPGRAAVIGADVALALAFAHRHGVVHRDIKPSNVLLTEDGMVKVADFGIARAVTNDEDLTQTGAVLGTATYISPEQARGEDLDGRSDVYSLGIVMYEMLTGTAPFLAETPIAVAYKHVTERPAAPRSINPSIPPALETIVLKCLQKDRANRYSDAGELRSDLLRFLDDRPIRAGTVEMAAVAETTLLAAGVTTAGPRTQFISPIESTSSIPIVGANSTQPKRRHRVWPWILLLIIILLLAAAGIIFGKKLLASHARPKPTVTTVLVPNVTGAGEQGATSALTRAGLQSNIQFRNSSQSSGTVIGESPRGGSRAKKGSTVTLLVSSGPASVTVPNVKGQSSATAESTLLAKSFNVSTNYKHASASQGTVIGESPAAGQSVAKGSTVILTVSSGPSQLTVPNVAGDSLATASNKLGSDGLQVGSVSYQTSNSVPSGDVISTSPSSGSQVAPNSSVNLTVSSGSSTAVPNVAGDTVAKATTTLQNAGFTVASQNQYQTSSTVPSGDVISTTPASGTQEPAGTSITLTVSSGSSPTSPTSPGSGGGGSGPPSASG
ncbi:Stk1 family PASTA domain-containing Ser/Thr kinase [Ferrimicrobium acidiphilum]|uniref:non-specific serine/threonine protein kinase n=1 Tax=Ferrimicrobium acidiphilum DSM 19497 TaxID=1121877 RepID=A0A0D8FTE6_9ACTN|nr:Stk1 family PASTA domain-containing Ser/Thr kinase [Ferrimicrobium acidiphilum]KJE76555.1 serine/threonine-protein kinase PknB [Ferrimicrobium acidiphilum DSM 19497]MCL5053349.1 Stk1 family PASTA domain-containing Ser/Thr kinase [Gammaproteobacteria bacterium]